MQVPYLEKDKWPSMKEPGEKTVSDKKVSGDDLLNELQVLIIEELFRGLERKNTVEVKEALISLIHSIYQQEE